MKTILKPEKIKDNLYSLNQVCPVVKSRAVFVWSKVNSETPTSYLHNVIIGSDECFNCVNFIEYDSEKMEIICGGKNE